MSIPARERLTYSEQAISHSWAGVKTIGRITMAAIEGAIGGALENAAGEAHLCKLERAEKEEYLSEVEQHANSIEAHKEL